MSFQKCLFMPGCVNPSRFHAVMLAILIFLPQTSRAQTQPWERKELDQLCVKYLGAAPPASANEAQARDWLDRLTRAVGRQLAISGQAGVPTEDIAVLALLQTRETAAGLGTAGTSQPTKTAPPPAAPASAAQSLPSETASTQQQVHNGGNAAQNPADQNANIEKGEEGIRQAEEQLAKLPLSRRMVITGDLSSVLQGATVPDAPNLATTVGRARVNFVLRAISSSKKYGLGDGYFFVRMEAAGGAPDSSAVGGPVSFTPFDQIAASRSIFNEHTRGNLYLGKVYYQQRVNFGKDYLEGRAGIIDLTDYFDTNLFANNEARQFLNYAFVNDPAFKAAIIAPGIMAEYHHPVHRDWLNELVFKGGYTITRINRAFTSPLWTGELELQTQFGGRQGHWRFGGSIGNRAASGAIGGFHLSMDQWLTSKFGIFGRYGVSNSGPGALALGPVHEAYSAGVQWHFAGPQDRTSTWSLGFSQAFPIQSGTPLASEKVIETYYRWQWSPNISVSPDFQLIFGSGGLRKGGTQAVFGTRLNFSY